MQNEPTVNVPTAFPVAQLIAEARDLMASQQMMPGLDAPDDGALDELEKLMRRAYTYGFEDGGMFVVAKMAELNPPPTSTERPE